MPHVLARHVDLFPIDGKVDTAQETHVEPCGCDDDVGVEFLTAVELNAVRDYIFDCVGHDAGAAAVQGFEEIAVGA